MRLTIPRVEARGKYEVVGNVLLLPVRSNGDFWAEFTDITAVIKVYGKETTRDNDVYMNIEKLGLDFTMKNARFKVKDNINSQNVLGMYHFANKQTKCSMKCVWSPILYSFIVIFCAQVRPSTSF